MRVLYIGGTGEISFDCVHHCVRAGYDVHVYNRGNHNHGLPPDVTLHRGDIHDDTAYSKLAEQNFDVVCQFHLFTTNEIQRDIDLFAGRCAQYVFISTASAYQKPLRTVPITEDVPLDNPYWAYSRTKAAMEKLLSEQDKLPWTVVRPSLTYRTRMALPFDSPVTVSRLLRGKPVIVHGDGESLWTATHAEDFAPRFGPLLGDRRALGEAFHITHDRAWSWNAIYEAVAAALNIDDPQLVHVPSDTLVRYKPDWEGPLFGDKAASAVFDNRKVKSIAGDVPCRIDPPRGMKLVAERFPPSADHFDADEDALHDRIIADQSALGR